MIIVDLAESGLPGIVLAIKSGLQSKVTRTRARTGARYFVLTNNYTFFWK